MLAFIKKLFSKSELRNETRSIESSGQIEDIQPKLVGKFAEAYFATYLKRAISKELIPEYLKVRQFILNCDITEQQKVKFAKYLDNFTLAEVIDVPTDSMVKFAKQFFVLHYKCGDKDLIDYLNKIK